MKRNNKVFFLLLVAEIAFLFGWWLKIEHDIGKLDKKLQKAQDEIQQILEKNKKLQTILEEKINDPFFIEKMAREKLGLAKKGEVVYKIVSKGK